MTNTANTVLSILFPRRQRDARIATRLAAIAVRSRGLSRSSGIRRTVSVPTISMAEMVAVRS